MGSSVGVTKAHDVEGLGDAIEYALTYDEWVVVEEAVPGREIEVAVLGGTEPVASGAGEIIPGEEFYSYEDKYVTDDAQLLVPAPLSAADTEHVRGLAVDVFKALRCDGLARVDFFLAQGGRGFLCNEANTMPGFTPISMFPKLCRPPGCPTRPSSIASSSWRSSASHGGAATPSTERPLRSPATQAVVGRSLALTRSHPDTVISMATTGTLTLPLGSPAPDFTLPG